MLKTIWCALLLSACVAWAQAAPTSAPPAASAPQGSASQAAPANPQTAPAAAGQESPAAPAAANKELPPDAPVVTIEGYCQQPTPNKADCKTVVTRAEFETLQKALAQEMPAAQQRNLAMRYAQLMVMADEAKKMGLDKSPNMPELMKFASMQALAQELVRTLQERSKPAPGEVEKYYNEHPERFQEAKLQRIYVPKVRPGAQKQPEEAAVKADTEKIRARAVAGEDFDKLQKEVFTSAGLKTEPPRADIGSLRPDNLPPSQTAVFSLKPGEISQAFAEPGGFYLYKMISKSKTPLEQVQPELQKQLEGDKFRESIEGFTKNVKPTLNDNYFGAVAGPEVMGEMEAGERRRPGPPTAGTTPSAAPVSKPAAAPAAKASTTKKAPAKPETKPH